MPGVPWYIRIPLALLGGLRRALAAVLGWVGRHPREAAILALIAFSAFCWRGWSRDHALADHWRRLFTLQRAEFVRLETTIIRVGITRVKADAANIARVKRDQAAITERTRHDLEKRNAADLAALRERMRGQAIGQERIVCDGGAGTTELPVLSAMPAGSVRAGAASVISNDDARLCVLNSNRLAALIVAWDAQAAVDVNGNAGAGVIPAE